MSEDVKSKACVMGWPISHSLSPVLHNYWLEKYGINGQFTPMAIMPEQLKQALTMIKDRGFRGCNLTLPLKELALPMMDEHDESCLMSGAINTVVIEDGVMTGYNSDGFGFVESLRSQNPDWDGTRVVILGTGGAARGIIASLRPAGAKHFVLVNRTREKAEKIIERFKLDAEVVDWQHRGEALKDATLLINCSSLGMTGQPPLEISLDHLPDTATVCDIVYTPFMTPLLQTAKTRGHRIVEGLPMLLHQGRLGFEYWFGRDPEVTTDVYDIMSKTILESDA